MKRRPIIPQISITDTSVKSWTQRHLSAHKRFTSKPLTKIRLVLESSSPFLSYSLLLFISLQVIIHTQLTMSQVHSIRQKRNMFGKQKANWKKYFVDGSLSTTLSNFDDITICHFISKWIKISFDSFKFHNIPWNNWQL